ncbi:HNH endonuclease domain-containing protein [Actinokineospora auranticolor]|uniref:HNH endonuclease n=1 Tax=Actinokineospora auranticolor TaxID=155976 RepID=A0A2S6GT96_9PSEU|nr:HNH endonuclease domain-containing protein [Actinokineospora auranticolor]PPK68397.1 HNH endonuclease [Actinokineospora auranticolor]
MTDALYRVEPTPWSSWRMAVLLGENSRTYKFALAHALLETAGEGRAEVRLSELAVPYALSLVEHLSTAPQAPGKSELGDQDFLTVAGQEADRTRESGRPTERLLDVAGRSMRQMVLRKFPNLRGGGRLPHEFYRVTGGADPTVELTAEMLAIATSERAAGLRAELAARWNIVESSFTLEIGRGLLRDGLAVDLDSSALRDRYRRRPIAGLTDSVIGFQHGRCLICDEIITPDTATAVDHVFPHALMRRYGSVAGWQGPDLDLLWNLAPAHHDCNSAKSDRLPTNAELRRLAERNDAILESPHPLRRTLELNLVDAGFPGKTGQWARFLAKVQEAFR